MVEFGLVWLSSVWFDEVDFLKCSRLASQLSFTNLFNLGSQENVKTEVNFQCTSSSKTVFVNVLHNHHTAGIDVTSCCQSWHHTFYKPNHLQIIEAKIE